MNEDIRKKIKEKSLICTRPFTHIEIQMNGDAYCCCADYNHDYKIGNIFKKSFEEIWNGRKTTTLRKDVLSGKYKHCNLDLCYNIEAPCFTDAKTFSSKVEYPYKVGIHADIRCNVSCIFCRDEKLTSEKYTKKHMALIDSLYIPMLKNARLVILNGEGELFVSKFYKDLIRKISKTYPEIRFEILTNGLLCDEKNIEKFGLKDKMDLVMVSLHAATEETYNKIVRGSNFNKVIENIKYLAKLKKEEKLGELILSYVITSLNYKDLPEFIEFTHSIGAIPQIWAVRQKGDSEFCAKRFAEYDVANPSHPEHKEYMKILEHPVFKKYSVITTELVSEESNETIKQFFEK